ncbi:MAG: hypothetical protein ABI356_07745 [Steroidobacteraceae bacterium]
MGSEDRMMQTTGLNRRDAIRLLSAGAALLRWGAADSAIRGTADDVLPMPVSVGQAIVEEHAQLMLAIRASGAEVLTIPDLLSSAIAAARGHGAWETWLRGTHPKLIPLPRCQGVLCF